MKARGKIIHKTINKHLYKFIICASQLDSYAIMGMNENTRTFFSCPTPFADELYYSGMISSKKHEKFKKFETQIFKSCTYLSFHWETYADYVNKYYKYNEGNIVKMNKGTDEVSIKAEYNKTPKIIYFGNLAGHWINLPLLSSLSKIYPIDVYGFPVPDSKYGLNYKGYATSDILSEYQFGLITITHDNLRREGFSAEHLDYLSHGLLVLVPEWRENAKNLKGTILFNEENFLAQIKYYSQEEQWKSLSKEALKQAEGLKWENSLRVFDDIFGLPFALEASL